jgi:hypothetical protein
MFHMAVWPHNAYMFRSLKPFHFIIQILIALPGISLIELLQSLSGLRKSTLLQRNNIQTHSQLNPRAAASASGFLQVTLSKALRIQFRAEYDLGRPEHFR